MATKGKDLNMPNHTTNQLRITVPVRYGNDVARLLFTDWNPETDLGDPVRPSGARLGTDEVLAPRFSYEALLPMPEILRRSHSGFDGVEHKSWTHDEIDGEKVERPWTAAEQAELQRLGYVSWYDWANAVWGVKWDAYDVSVLECYFGDDAAEFVIEFQSPWDAPREWFKELLERIQALAKGDTSKVECNLGFRHEDDAPFPHSVGTERL
jgi:hypothetical protein